MASFHGAMPAITECRPWEYSKVVDDLCNMALDSKLSTQHSNSEAWKMSAITASILMEGRGIIPEEPLDGRCTR